MDLDAVADELYALAPDEFTKARDDVAKAADGVLRKAVKALRKPTAGAHAVNMLVREHSDEIEALLALGDELRAAVGSDAESVRRLTQERRELIGELVDHELPVGVQQDVTATLEAATADPALAAAVRSGRLVKPLRYAGFGEYPDLDDAVATPLRAEPKPKAAAKKPAVTTAKKSAPAKQTARKHQQPTREHQGPDPHELARLREQVLDLAGKADDAQTRYDAAVRAAVEARRMLENAEAERADAHKAARAAHEAAEKARRELGRLERT